MKRIPHQNTYGDISSLPLCAPLKGAEVFRNTKGADVQACVHAEIDKSFYCSEKPAEIVPLLSNNYFFPPSPLKKESFSMSTADRKVI